MADNLNHVTGAPVNFLHDVDGAFEQVYNCQDCVTPKGEEVFLDYRCVCVGGALDLFAWRPAYVNAAQSLQRVFFKVTKVP